MQNKISYSVQEGASGDVVECSIMHTATLYALELAEASEKPVVIWRVYEDKREIAKVYYKNEQGYVETI